MDKRNVNGVSRIVAVLIAIVIILAIVAAVEPMLLPATTITKTETKTVEKTVTSAIGAATVTVEKTVTTTVGVAPKKELVVRAVFQTPVSEPWVGAIHTAILAVNEEFEAKGIKVDYKFVDKKIDPKEFELALEDAAKVADIVFLDAFLKEDIARRVAKKYPNVAFAAGSEYLPTEPNFAVFDNWLHQPAFLAGVIAGKITKTNKIGIVAAMEINEVNRIVNAFILGAKTVNPDVKAKVVYLLGNIPPGESPWYHPATAKRLAKTLIDLGVDVIFAERVGAEEAAREAYAEGKGVWAIGNMADQYERAPEVTITSLVWDMRPTVRVAFERVLAGTWTPDNLGTYSWMTFHGSYLADFHHFGKPSPPLTKEIIDLVKEWETKIMEGATWIPIVETPPVSDF
ncbi:MAG: BMP family protein [Thaumarchaeota archaeon]|jgi:basic membrane lipoprotein Med (substrate-binding protein (PBP1-ABC) superfamily)|nr:BMP family protein [Candidatus Geocrenenecus arthurdayi]